MAAKHFRTFSMLIQYSNSYFGTSLDEIFHQENFIHCYNEIISEKYHFCTFLMLFSNSIYFLNFSKHTCIYMCIPMHVCMYLYIYTHFCIYLFYCATNGCCAFCSINLTYVLNMKLHYLILKDIVRCFMQKKVFKFSGFISK